jgi:hypothetical protein
VSTPEKCSQGNQFCGDFEVDEADIEKHPAGGSGKAEKMLLPKGISRLAGSVQQSCVQQS